jgi:hypothetical protein
MYAGPERKRVNHEQAFDLREAKKRLILKRRSVLSALTGTAPGQPTEALWSEIYAMSREICDIDRQLGLPSILPMPPARTDRHD